MANKVVVNQDEDAPVERPVLAQAIVDISKAAQKLADSGLNQRAIRLLVADQSGVPMTTVGYVLNALVVLESVYCASPKRSTKR